MKEAEAPPEKYSPGIYSVKPEFAIGESIFFSMFCGHVDRDTAAGHEIADNLHPFRFACSNEIIQDRIDSNFMKSVVVAVGKEIKFQCFAFDALFLCDVIDRDVTEIGLSGNGTEAGEFRTVESDDIISFRECVPEGLDFCLFGRIRENPGNLCDSFSEV